MKVITLLLMLLAFKSFAQQNFYTFNNGNYLDEAKVHLALDTVRKTLPPSYHLKGVIYHKVIKKDSVINYINFAVSEGPVSDKTASSELQFEFKQDSTFLLLNKKLPFFKLKDMDGKEINSDDLLGKPTMINFWAIYCGPCIAEMPDLSKLKEKYKDKMNFVSITENQAVKDHLHNFLKDKNFNFQVLENGELYKKALSIAAIPRNLFIDKNGILRYIQVNYPLNAKAKALAIDDKSNYFVQIIDQLISDTK